MAQLATTVRVSKENQSKLNKLLQKRESLKTLAKDIENQLEEINTEILNICPEGNTRYETNMYTVLISIIEGRYTVSNKELQTKYPKIFDELKKQSDSYLKINPAKVKKEVKNL